MTGNVCNTVLLSDILLIIPFSVASIDCAPDTTVTEAESAIPVLSNTSKGFCCAIYSTSEAPSILGLSDGAMTRSLEHGFSTQHKLEDSTF